MNGTIYAIRTETFPKRRLINNDLYRLFELVAKKYQVIHGKRGKVIYLYDDVFEDVYLSNTVRFVAKYATKFIRKVPLQDNPIHCAGRYASKNQIMLLLNENSRFTSVNTIFILVVLLKLLLLDERSKEFRNLSCRKKSIMPVTEKNIIPNDIEDDIAVSFLKQHIENLLNDPYYRHYVPSRHFICEYIIDCYDELIELVGNNAIDALRKAKNKAEGNMGILAVQPLQMPRYPATM